MSGRRGDEEATAGEVRRRDGLARPPGERYRSRSAPVATGPAHLRGALAGLLVGGATALVLGLLSAILDVTLGLLVVAVVGGWAIGVAVVRATWRSTGQPAADATRVIGAACGVLAWLGGRLVDWLVSLAILPGSTLSIGERLVNSPFIVWLTPQLSLIDGGQLLLLAALAWRSAR
ncbi:MAG: hypothetical protein H0V36_01030 [Chloroflexi bacterium]|nr:hypothetical protein [Chloroflexota bacterium]